MAKNPRLKKHQLAFGQTSQRLNRWLQVIKTRWNQVKLQGMLQLAKTCWIQQKSERGKEEEKRFKTTWRLEGLQPETSSSLSRIQILSVASAVFPLAGLYYKRKELVALINKPQPQPQAQQREMQRNTQPQIASWRPTPYRPVYQKCLIVSLWASATLTGLAAGTVWVAKKVIKQPVTSDPSSNFMNYVKFTVVIAASIATKRYYLKVLN